MGSASLLSKCCDSSEMKMYLEEFLTWQSHGIQNSTTSAIMDFALRPLGAEPRETPHLTLGARETPRLEGEVPDSYANEALVRIIRKCLCPSTDSDLLIAVGADNEVNLSKAQPAIWEGDQKRIEHLALSQLQRCVSQKA